MLRINRWMQHVAAKRSQSPKVLAVTRPPSLLASKAVTITNLLVIDSGLWECKQNSTCTVFLSQLLLPNAHTHTPSPKICSFRLGRVPLSKKVLVEAWRVAVGRGNWQKSRSSYWSRRAFPLVQRHLWMQSNLFSGIHKINPGLSTLTYECQQMPNLGHWL